MSESYEERRNRWGRTVEDVLIEIMQEKTEQGLYFMTDSTPVIRTFDKLLAEVDSGRRSHKFRRNLDE